MKKYNLVILMISAILSFSVAQAALGYGVPPGLEGKGGSEFPKGLEKQEKVPGGWSHGEKKGWDKHYHHHHHHHEHKHNDN